MTPPRVPPILPAIVLGVLSLAPSPRAAGQGGAGSSVTPVTFTTPVAPPELRPYQDRYIANGSLTPDISDGDGGAEDGPGRARSLQIDAALSSLSSRVGSTETNVVEPGIVVRSQWDSANYGTWSLDMAARTGGSGLDDYSQGRGVLLTLRQRGMAFDGGWSADNAIGDLNLPELSLLRSQPRFYLPTGPMEGFTTEWRGPSGLEIVAGGGEPGLFDGIEVPDFRTLGGSTATVGAQWSPAPSWHVGGQFTDAHDVTPLVGFDVEGEHPVNSEAGVLSGAWQGSHETVQLSVIDGSTGGGSNSTGAWLDASLGGNRILQSAGVFRIDPNLSWGNQWISSDAQGGYYRVDYQSRRWLADLDIEQVNSVSGNGGHTTFFSGDSRYQVSRDWGVGAVTDVSHSTGGTGWSLEGYLDHLDPWGTGRAQASFAQTPDGQDANLTLDQAWNLDAGMHLSTSTSVERVRSTELWQQVQDHTLFSVGAFGGGQLTSRLGIDGNIRWVTAVSGAGAPGLAANLSLHWQLNRKWELLVSYYASAVGSWTLPAVNSPLMPTAPQAIPSIRQRGVFLTARHQWSAGSHAIPLGGVPGGASGEISGVIYLDANENGRLDALESCVAHVTVVLDGRYSVQTDSNGRFEYPQVAPGRHLLSVIGDNLPLPWTLVDQGRTEVMVSTRGRADVSIGAHRIQ